MIGPEPPMRLRSTNRTFPLLLLALVLAARVFGVAQTADSGTPQTVPAPSTQQASSPRISSAAAHPHTDPCSARNTGATMMVTGSMRAMAIAGIEGINASAGSAAIETKVCVHHLPMIDWYARFVTGPEVKPLTVEEKGRLAVHNLMDPFNLITIGGDAAISVAANSHSPYGPGIPGWSRYVGVSFTQDLTGEFIGTFAIPSLDHQDPHYHRMPNASIPRRILHCIAQIGWTQGDDGRGMVNYASLGGFAIENEIANLYVPGLQTRASATAERYATGLATAPIDNFEVEFLPDVARHIHIQIVVVQRVINQVARTDASGQ